jgi:two-component system NtrC family sensor kinase
MKIEHKLILSYIFNVAFIALIGFFSIQNMNLVLTKLRFVEIADDLNASFLEMRISEKNFFLYKDKTALSDINEKIKNTEESVEAVRDDISRAVGNNNLTQLGVYLQKYANAADEIRKHRTRDPRLELTLRTEGQKLREFFKTITQLERKKVNSIILNSKKVLYVSFWCILFLAVVVGRYVSKKILDSLRAVEKAAVSISKGDFRKIEDIKSNDEVGSVIKAVNRMSEELMNREEEIIQSKKLASLGILTAGVAHEMTNPLNNISMIAQNFVSLYDSLNKDTRIEMIEKVDEETKRIEEIVKNLLDFSKPKEVNRKEANINDVVRKAVKLMKNTLDISNVELHLSLSSGLPHVSIDNNQVQQVFINLIVNAVQAMSNGGKLFIATGLGGEHVVKIEVRDTGKGIAPEFLPYIFDPFFTTKGVEGTGLGMSVSYGIIKSHKGTIRVESGLDVGTVFIIELPVYST